MIQQILLSHSSVVNDAMARTADADQELLRLAMSVLAANVLALHVENQKVTLDLEGNVVAGFTEAEEPAQVLDERQVVEGDSLHPRRPAAGFDSSQSGLVRVEGGLFGADITNDPGRVAGR